MLVGNVPFVLFVFFFFFLFPGEKEEGVLTMNHTLVFFLFFFFAIKG